MAIRVDVAYGRDGENRGPGQPYATIQNAIRSGRVEVRPGYYREGALLVPAGLQLIGIWPIVIEGYFDARLLGETDQEVLIENVTVKLPANTALVINDRYQKVRLYNVKI